MSARVECMLRGALDLRSGESSVRGSRGYAIPHGACSNRNARPASVTRRSRQPKPNQEDRLCTTEMTASTQSPGLPTRFSTSSQIRFAGLNACQTSTSRKLTFSGEATCRHNHGRVRGARGPSAGGAYLSGGLPASVGPMAELHPACTRGDRRSSKGGGITSAPDRAVT